MVEHPLDIRKRTIEAFGTYTRGVFIVIINKTSSGKYMVDGKIHCIVQVNEL